MAMSLVSCLTLIFSKTACALERVRAVAKMVLGRAETSASTTAWAMLSGPTPVMRTRLSYISTGAMTISLVGVLLTRLSVDAVLKSFRQLRCGSVDIELQSRGHVAVPENSIAKQAGQGGWSHITTSATLPLKYPSTGPRPWGVLQYAHYTMVSTAVSTFSLGSDLLLWWRLSLLTLFDFCQGDYLEKWLTPSRQGTSICSPCMSTSNLDGETHDD